MKFRQTMCQYLWRFSTDFYNEGSTLIQNHCLCCQRLHFSILQQHRMSKIFYCHRSAYASLPDSFSSWNSACLCCKHEK